MAAADDAQPWRRDTLADANPELTRKRQRTSEDSHSSSPSNAGSVVVEAVMPEDPTTAQTVPIHLHHAMESYSDGFNILPLSSTQLTAVEQLNKLIAHVNIRRCLPSLFFRNLSDWLETHMEHTRHTDVWKYAYPLDHEFFGTLAILLRAILACDEPFDAEDLIQFGQRTIADLVPGFFVSTITLSARMVSCLPEIVSATIARRDSAQIQRQQHIDLLNFVPVLGQLLTPATAAIRYFERHLNLNWELRVQVMRRKVFLSLNIPETMAQLLHRLCQCHREVTRSWEAIDGILKSALTLNLTPDGHAETIMNAAHSYVLPLIREKHPRALPDGFHEMFVDTCASCLKYLVKAATTEQIEAIYNRYVKCDSDALVPKMNSDQQKSWAAAFHDLNGDQQELEAELIGTAWTLKTLKSFIFSEIMDVRGCGITMLNSRLAEAYNGYRSLPQSLDHPILQYMARFIKTNELTEYIFGPNSHANLVTHSSNVVGFLAVVHAYTDRETDIIWNACTSSVEAEFVKASFAVLSSITPLLERERMLYLVRRYTVTPSSKLGKDAIEFLPELLRILSTQTDRGQDPKSHLITALISVDIIKQHGQAVHDPSAVNLCRMAKAELSKFAYGRRPVKDQVEILDYCVTDLAVASDHASACSEIINLFLRQIHEPSNSSLITEKIPTSLVVAELTQFVDSSRTAGTTEQMHLVRMTAVRLENAIRLLALDVGHFDENVVSCLSDACFGHSALSTAARNEAWATVRELAYERAPAYVATLTQTLLDHMLSNTVDKFSLTHFTAMSTSVLHHALSRQMSTEPLKSNIIGLLELPVWLKLVEIAERHEDVLVRSAAVHVIWACLFDYSPVTSDADVTGSSIAVCQTQFLRKQMRKLMREYDDRADNTQQSAQTTAQQIDLLTTLLLKSKTGRKPHRTEQQALQNITLNPDQEDIGQLLDYILDIHAGPTHERIQLQAASHTKLNDLLARLTHLTGADSFTVIVAGQPVDTDRQSQSLLSAVVTQTSNVIVTRLEYAFGAELNDRLIKRSAIELDIVEHYAGLQDMLAGPEEIARKVYTLLVEFRPTPTARQSIMGRNLSMDDLFPIESPWKTAFSLHLMSTHLHDARSLGIADLDFIRDSIHLLTSFVMDGKRASALVILLKSISCLSDFVQGLSSDPPTRRRFAHRATEEPRVTVHPGLVRDVDGFVSCMVDILLQSTEADPAMLDPNCVNLLATKAYALLVQLFRHQPTVWESFTKHARIKELHARAMFDPSLFLIVQSITNFCQHDSTDSITNFYLDIVMSLLPQGLAKGTQSNTYFGFAKDIVHAANGLQIDETKVRSLVDSLIAQISTYEHTESVNLPVVDVAMLGILQLMESALFVFKSYKKPFGLDTFAATIFKTLLFPSAVDERAKPLLHQHSRYIAFSIVRLTCESQATFSELVAASAHALTSAEQHAQHQNPHSSAMRSASDCTGLHNLGMTCYMNSLIQQLYANVHFRKFIFEIPVHEDDRHPCLRELQSLFAHMQSDISSVICPDGLAQILNVRTDSQEDVHGFYEDFLSRLESEMPDPETKIALNRFFTGCLISQIKGELGEALPYCRLMAKKLD